jgi:dihydrofolate reductase/thymidylate synthase
VSFDIVVAADLDWGIGKDNRLPWPKLRADLAHFRRVTTTAPADKRNAIVMGRKTWQSTEVAGRALPNRLNVVVTRGALDVPAGVVVAGSLPAAIAAARVDAGVADVFVVGGGDLYREAIASGDLRWIYLTRVAAQFACDVTIPDLAAIGYAPTAWDGTTDLVDAITNVPYRIERWARCSPATF